MKKQLLVLLALCFSSMALAKQPITVVASVKPLQLVAQSVVGDLGVVNVLIPEGSSPHHYALKPSDMRKLGKADLVLWIGPNLEQFLSKPLHKVKAEKLQLLLSDAGEDAHHNEGAHEEHHDHHHEQDPHLWMDVVAMLQAADQLHQQLGLQYPEHQAALKANFEQFAADLINKDRKIMNQLRPYQGEGFVVFHDAFSLFVKRYDLNQLAYFTLDPARAPGAKTVHKIQTLLKQEQAGCVFIEPQFEAAIVKQVVSDLPVKLGKLDPLAIGIDRKTGYLGYLQQLADNIENCLKP